MQEGVPIDEIAVDGRQDDGINRIAFSSDGAQLAATSPNGTIRIWDASTGRTLRVLRAHMRAVYGVAFSPDGSRIATASEDRTIRLWDSATGEVMAELRGHAGYVHSVSFSPDGTKLISASGDGTVRIWDSVILRGRSR